MDRLQAMEMFVRVVETGSFSATAREFATTQPTVTKQVAAIEARLKVRLLNRNTRGVSLTEAGALYYEKCKLIVREAEEADSVVRTRQTQAQGLLRIGSSVAFGRRVLVPLALEFMLLHPQLQVDLSFEDRYTDLVGQGIDVAVRMGQVAIHRWRPLPGVNPRLMVASTGYLRKHGTPGGRRAERAPGPDHTAAQGSDVWRVLSPRGGDDGADHRTPLQQPVGSARRRPFPTAAAFRYVASDLLAPAPWVEVLKGHSLPEQIHCVPSPSWCRRRCRPSMFLQGG
jgi:DNA-binding transcriptional LysR family regulator